ncbi:YhaN family protein [Glaciimonas immobilis]|uniref:Uncharacterized protein YhaN n=1 Tax=Glaciimonas immobilis TaxID=728004 RepID=A0A840RQU6_9BURK|nr:YhaN family protein [Glaciimonas immobilis]KAF3999691.1 AAA family ATPase [Glaciimonas immobilis]MBB5200135.1 uncharacterized protein YhaN [Glaciimonas immobilis]
MRLHQLQLIKYGKFTDRSVDFPKAVHDFHFIVGPNEAGKSTLRSAIQDLLFGIATRSPLAFVHPLSDLRLGASISEGDMALDFHRAKATKNTLRTPHNEAMTDTVLVPFLGATDRNFFDQMFGLDHAKLIQGGKSILSAENDIGQILFQSAAGIAGLGKIRDALVTEAESLWGPRKAADREYYIAQEKLDDASAMLKAASIKAKAWEEANRTVDELQTALSDEIALHGKLNGNRNRLERLRRTAPFWITIREMENQLRDLGEVIEMSANAEVQLAKALVDKAGGEHQLDFRDSEVERISLELKNVPLNNAVFECSSDITDLNEKRLRYSAYANDIGRREIEVKELWKEVIRVCEQLTWPAETDALLFQRIPTLLVRRALEASALAHSGLQQALQGAQSAETSKKNDLSDVIEQINDLGNRVVPVILRAALNTARAMGETQSTSRTHETNLRKASAALETSLQALGSWRKTVAQLAVSLLPESSTISRLEQDRLALYTENKNASQQLEDDEIEVKRIALSITQFQDLHHPTTKDDVTHARDQRNLSWTAIKSRTVTMDEGGNSFEAAMDHADTMADHRLDQVEESAALQSLQHELQRAIAKHTASTARLLRAETSAHQFDTAWNDTTNAVGLSGLPLEAAREWLVKTAKTLDCNVSYQMAQEAADAYQAQTATARQTLLIALGTVGVVVGEDELLSTLCAHAELFIKDADNTAIRYEGLSIQCKSATAVLKTLAQSVEDAHHALAQWNRSWLATLDKARLPPDSNVGSAKGALELIAALEDKLNRMREIRVNRIEAMNDDLAEFDGQARKLAEQLDATLVSQSGAAIAQALAVRLLKAREAQKDSVRLKTALRLAQEQVIAAKESIKSADAQLQPLLERARVDTTDQLADCIARSALKKVCQNTLANAVENFLAGGDGLTRDRIEGELAEVDIAEIGTELTHIQAALSSAVERQGLLSAEHANAVRSLAEMTGSDDAATAEARRQEALAQMTDAAERYVRVCTAVRLLKWSIERYREQKQGPMLARASALFSKLTLGAFKKLHVDFERETLTLEGQRDTGQLVGIAAMSDGTRDQLYFALRLAALELHLDQALALPFIADDLFINYDDDRAKAGLEALKELSTKTQVIFLSHHAHLVDIVKEVFGYDVNIVTVER